MLSPMQHPPSQSTSATSEAEKSRPDELNIKSFVPTKPLPIPTPSREATLTQKLELALGKFSLKREKKNVHLKNLFF